MAVLITTDIPGGSEQQDRQMMQEMNIASNPPVGAICRAGAVIPGGYRIMSLWESREDFEEFFKNRVQPAAARIGMKPGRYEVLGVVNVNVQQRQTAGVR